MDCLGQVGLAYTFSTRKPRTDDGEPMEDLESQMEIIVEKNWKLKSRLIDEKGRLQLSKESRITGLLGLLVTGVCEL